MSAIKYLLFIYCFFIVHLSFGQYPWISSLPTYYHPSFAGSSGKPRIAFNNTLTFQEKNIIYSAKNYNNRCIISYDNFLTKLHSGIGVSLRYSNDGYIHKYVKFITNSGEINATIAPKFSFNGRFTLSPSFQVYKSFEFVKADLNYPLSGDSTISSLDTNITRHNSGLKIGMMVNTKKLFVGIGFFMNQYTPFYNQNGLIGKGGNLFILTGYTFKFREASKFSFTPVIMYGFNRTIFVMNEDYDINYDNIYLELKYSKFFAGVSLRREIMLGYKTEKFQFMFTGRYGSFGKKLLSEPPAFYTGQLSVKYIFGTGNASQ